MGIVVLCLSTLYTGCIKDGDMLSDEEIFFASARSIQVASRAARLLLRDMQLCLSTLYTGCIHGRACHFPPGKLCLSTLYTGCISDLAAVTKDADALPQHALYRLHHRSNKTDEEYYHLCLSTLYTGCIFCNPLLCRHIILCLSTLYTGCILLSLRLRGKIPLFASARSIQVASWYNIVDRLSDSLCLSTLYTGCIGKNTHCSC